MGCKTDDAVLEDVANFIGQVLVDWMLNAQSLFEMQSKST